MRSKQDAAGLEDAKELFDMGMTKGIVRYFCVPIVWLWYGKQVLRYPGWDLNDDLGAILGLGIVWLVVLWFLWRPLLARQKTHDLGAYDSYVEYWRRMRREEKRQFNRQ